MRADRRCHLAGAALALLPRSAVSLAVLPLSLWPTPGRAEGAPVLGRPLRVVASFSILADIVRKVAGPAAVVESLVAADSDAHVFEPTPQQARRVAEADLVVVNGLAFEGFMPRLVAASGYRGPVLVASSGIVPRRLGDGVDPHVWQSLAHAQRMAGTIAEALARALPAQAVAVQQRRAAYADSLAMLDRQVRTRFAPVPREQRRVVTSHDAFGYFGDAYGIDFFAPLGGSTESEPSAATVARLAVQIQRQAIRAVFIENISDPRLVGRIAKEGGAVVGGKLYSDALSPPGSEADTYLKLFAHNASTIATALGAVRIGHGERRQAALLA